MTYDRPSVRDSVNFRDLGGYRSADGRYVRYGCFYRSGSLSRMNDEELAYLRSLHIRTLVDLRTSREAAKKPDPVLEGVRVLQHSGVVSSGGEQIDFSPAGMSQVGEAGERQIRLLTHYYRMMPYHNEAFHLLFREIAAEHVPILFHCATGKDRTGIAAMLILLLLGVPEETVLRDYLLSNEYRKDIIRRHMKEDADIIQIHPEHRELLQMQHGVSPKIGRMVLEDLKSRFGSYNGYFQAEYGFSPGEIGRLRDLYLASGSHA